jgi:uncharacterized protein
MKNQVIIIHGGDTFETYEEYLGFLRAYRIDIERYKTDKDDWKPWLRHELMKEYEVIIPAMPNKNNARFEEWELWFEKLIPFLNDDILLVGHSLGGAFLAKYLSENAFPKKIRGVFLAGAQFDKDCEGYPLLSFAMPGTIDLQSEKIFLYHSKDDPVVPFSAFESFRAALPNAEARIFEDRKHLNQEEFPELLADIKKFD